MQCQQQSDGNPDEVLMWQKYNIIIDIIRILEYSSFAKELKTQSWLGK